MSVLVVLTVAEVEMYTVATPELHTSCRSKLDAAAGTLMVKMR